MVNSILTSIKKQLGIEEQYIHYDSDIIIHINSALMNLNQLGVGPKGFTIEDSEAVWTDFLGTRKDLEFVKSLIYLKVRLLFDPPQSGFLLDSIRQSITELEWRINVQAEGGV